MTLVSELELPSFDYTDSTLRGERFHAAMRELRASGWLASGPYGYVVLDHEAGELFLRTRSAIFPGMKIAELFDVRDGALYEEMRRNILHINGADHTRLRSLVNPALSPRAVERYRPVAREFLRELFADMTGAADTAANADAMVNADTAGAADAPANPAATAGVPDSGEARAGHRCEFVEAMAKRYPSRMIASVMGAPLSDAPRLHHWSNWIQRQFDVASMMSERAGIEQAVAEFYEYAGALVAARRSDPADDLISKLIAAEQEGERLSDVECVNLVLNVLIGGVDTTQSQLAHAIRLFAEHPRQWELLARDPSLVDAAVEEVLRFEPITPFTARITTRELTVNGVTFPPDTIVMVCAFTGNRDVERRDGEVAAGGTAGGKDGDSDGETATTDTFDITARRGGARALTFGAGVHYCLGANLARVELQEALRFLAPRMRNLELDGDPVYESIMGIYGLSELPVRFSPGP